MADRAFRFHLRSQAFGQDAGGHNLWQVTTVERSVPATQTAIIVCDMWDKHWCRGAAERVDVMAPRMNAVLKAARARDALIIHAPSDTLEAYEGVPARRRIQEVAAVEPPPLREHLDPKLPIDDSDNGPDTGEVPWYAAWTREHAALEIDQERDVISDDGREIYSYLRFRGITQVIIMGVHVNMCVLGRSFGIKNMVRWGVDIALARDLTDAMYNPAMPPYVNHDEGTRLVVEFIEKFWCPTIASADLVG